MMANQLYTKGRLLLCMVIIWIAGLAAESRIGMPEVAAAGNDPGFEGWVQDDAGLPKEVGSPMNLEKFMGEDTFKMGEGCWM